MSTTATKLFYPLPQQKLRKLGFLRSTEGESREGLSIVEVGGPSLAQPRSTRLYDGRHSCLPGVAEISFPLFSLAHSPHLHAAIQ